MGNYNTLLEDLNNTPQTQAAPGKTQIKNAAGGYVFQTSEWTQFNRFLIIGATSGTFYAGKKDHFYSNYQNVINCIKKDGEQAVREIVSISDAGRAPKNNHAIFALALCIKEGDLNTRQAAYEAIPKVCRIGTHLFMLSGFLKKLGKGYGRGLKRAIANWYLNQKADNLAYNAIKYQAREGWSNADLLRLSHPKTSDAGLSAIFKWIVDKEVTEATNPKILAFEEAKTATVPNLIRLIKEHDLPREALPTECLKNPDIWRALLPKMGLTALIRNLGVMTACGLLKNFAPEVKTVVEKLTDTDLLKKARIHPLSVLLALRTYSNGRGDKGSLTWDPVDAIKVALEKAFDKSFNYVEPTGKNYLVSLDVSGSMTSLIPGAPIRSSEFAALIAVTIARAEQNVVIRGFSTTFMDLKITSTDNWNSAMKKTANHPFAGTDCSLPFKYARENNLDVDCFITITDNETWAGNTHPFQELEKYRKSGKQAKSIVIGTTATNCSIADPSDPDSLDIAGFDSSIPQLIAEFVK